MKILSVVNDLGHRGTQRAAQDYAIELKSRGVEVAVLAHAEGGPRAANLQQAGMPVWIGGTDLEGALQHARKYDADIVHIHRRGLPCKKESMICSAVKTAHNRILETNVFGRFDGTAGGRLIDVHLQLSKWNLYRWSKWARHDRLRAATVLPYPLSTESFRPASRSDVVGLREKHDIPQGGFLCGRVGKWSPDVFRAFVSLAERRGDVYLLCVEDAADVRPAVQTLVPTHLQRLVRFAPKMLDDAQLAVFYSTIDCLLHASQIGESFGLVMAEAMSCGSPVVTAARPHKDNAQIEIVGGQGMVAASARGLPDVLLRFYDLHRSGSLPFDPQSVRESIVSRYDRRRVVARFLDIAELSLRCRDRESLCAALRCTPDLVTDVGRHEAKRLLGMCQGRFSVSECVQMSAIHNPYIYRLYHALKGTGSAK
jgi:glycosyltransferase involved in cell wall biosynthesis